MFFGILEPLRGGDDIPLRKEELIVGRSEKSDIVLRFANVSANHCRLVLSRGYWYALDMGSSNGTVVGGLRVQDRRVDPDTCISFAKHDYVMRYDPVANGNDGSVPPEFLETDIFEKSLLERSGLSKSVRPYSPSPAAAKKSRGATLEELESGVPAFDYSQLTLDDLEFDN